MSVVQVDRTLHWVEIVEHVLVLVLHTVENGCILTRKNSVVNSESQKNLDYFCVQYRTSVVKIDKILQGVEIAKNNLVRACAKWRY